MREKHLMSTCTKFQVHLKKNYLAKYNKSKRTVMLNIYLQCKNRLGTKLACSSCDGDEVRSVATNTK
jgi:hypothetical protein